MTMPDALAWTQANKPMPNDSLPTAPSGEEQTEKKCPHGMTKPWGYFGPCRLCEPATFDDQVDALADRDARLASLSTERARMERERDEAREQLRLATIDAANLEAERTDALAQMAKASERSLASSAEVSRLTSELDRVGGALVKAKDAMADWLLGDDEVQPITDAYTTALIALGLTPPITDDPGVTPDATTRREG